MADSEDALNFKIDQILARNTTYDPEAYVFVVEAVRFAQEAHPAKSPMDEHIDVGELLQSIRIYALCEYGPLAKHVLNHWNVVTTEDIGRIIFLLAEEGEFELKPDDRLDEFRSVFDFDEALVNPFRLKQKKRPPTIPILDKE